MFDQYIDVTIPQSQRWKKSKDYKKPFVISSLIEKWMI